MTERKSTITREDVERILDRAMLDQPELRKRLRRVFGPLPPKIAQLPLQSGAGMIYVKSIDRAKNLEALLCAETHWVFLSSRAKLPVETWIRNLRSMVVHRSACSLESVGSVAMTILSELRNGKPVCVCIPKTSC